MDSGKKTARPPNPRATANPLSAFLFIWTWKIFRRGMKKEMEVEDLYEPLKEHKSDYLGDSFEKYWKKQVVDKKRPSLLKTLLSHYFWKFSLFAIPILVAELVFRVAQPIFLGRLIRFFEPDSNVSLEEAYLSAFGVIVCSGFTVFVRQSFLMGVIHLGMKMRVGVCSVIYRKSLRLTQTALGEATVGQVVNLLSNDVARFDMSLPHLVFLVIGPLQAVVSTYFMWEAMGISAVIGVLATLAFMPLQGFIGRLIAKFRLRCALKTDERVRLMNEIISGIQVIKLYAWEIPFSQLVSQARKNEIREIRIMSYLRAVMTSFERFTTRLTLFITVLCYVLLGNTVTAEKIFVVSSFFSIIRQSMTGFLPLAITTGAETLVSIKRIEKFLLYEELETSESYTAQHSQYGSVALIDKSHTIISQTKNEEKSANGPQEETSIVMSGATAKWTAESHENTLTDINLKVTSGQLLGVIGPVGSGKTSVLLTLLKELPLTSGSIVMKGRISYAAQEPWLFASSVRNNILFGEPYDKQRYREVVKVCALTRDFELLPYGDKTVVGDRGVSLSGGQKARINLARAVYKHADIYILDDPLSAVDAHVGRHLFENCICGYLANKTRILVTHQLQFLSHVDHIVILNEGRMEAHGTYNQLHESGLDFASLLEDQEGDDPQDENTLDERGGTRRSSLSRRKRQRESSIGSSTSSVEITAMQETTQKAAEEMRTRGQVTSSTYKSYLFANRKYFLVIVMVLSIFVAQLLSSGADYWLSFWTNTESLRAVMQSAANLTTYVDAIEGNYTDTNLPDDVSIMSRELCMYIFAAITAGAMVFLIYNSFLYFYLCMESSVNLHNKMFNCIIRLPMRFFNINPSGQILNRFSKDMGAMDEQLPLVLNDILAIGFILLGIVTLIAIVNYWILIPTLFVTIVFYLVRSVYVRTSRSVKRLEGITRSPVFSHLNASLQGLTTIRAFKAQKILQEEFDSYQDVHSTAFFLFVASGRAFGLFLDVVCLVYIACVTFSFLIMGQGILGGSVGLAISQSLGLTGMFQWFMRQSAELENQMTSVERVMEYGNLEDEGPLESKPDTKPHKSWPSHGKIVFQNVYMSYAAEEPPVLKNLNFTINPSDKIGIVGRTGAGKSSLIAAMFRLTNFEGSILIDDVDTKSIGLHDLRAKISIIPQEPVLFSGSLRKNLDPFDEYPDTVIWNALEEVELKEVVKELPAGLNHKMLEGGSNFSVGQRQLVCLARAIIRNNKILIMDEATANIDPRTDHLIQETVRRKFADCTVLTIAHRLLTVMDSDRILVMDAGKAMEFDHPHILLQNKSGFLWSMVQETGKSMAETLLRMAEKGYQDSGHEKKS